GVRRRRRVTAEVEIAARADRKHDRLVVLTEVAFERLRVASVENAARELGTGQIDPLFVGRITEHGDVAAVLDGDAWPDVDQDAAGNAGATIRPQCEPS